MNNFFTQVADAAESARMATGWSSNLVQVLALILLLRHLLVSAKPQYGDVRLVHSTPGDVTKDERVGIPEVYMNDKWGTIHVNDVSSSAGAAQIICKQLGAGEGNLYSRETYNITPAVGDDVPVVLFINHCPNRTISEHAMSHILRCNHSLPSNQDHDNDLIVGCEYWYDWYEAGYDTQVRLHWAGSEYNSSGFVEVYVNHNWNPVCNLGQYEADTVCRQLGYTNATQHGSSVSPYFVIASPQLDNFTCSSRSSDCLRDCFTYPPPDYYARSCYSFSWVNCSFDERKVKTSTAGSYAKCSNSTSEMDAKNCDSGEFPCWVGPDPTDIICVPIGMPCPDIPTTTRPSPSTTHSPTSTSSTSRSSTSSTPHTPSTSTTSASTTSPTSTTPPARQHTLLIILMAAGLPQPGVLVLMSVAVTLLSCCCCVLGRQQV